MAEQCFSVPPDPTKAAAAYEQRSERSEEIDRAQRYKTLLFGTARWGARGLVIQHQCRGLRPASNGSSMPKTDRDTTGSNGSSMPKTDRDTTGLSGALVCRLHDPGTAHR
jgi:hypothetical protein